MSEINEEESSAFMTTRDDDNDYYDNNDDLDEWNDFRHNHQQQQQRRRRQQQQLQQVQGVSRFRMMIVISILIIGAIVGVIIGEFMHDSTAANATTTNSANANAENEEVLRRDPNGIEIVSQQQQQQQQEEDNMMITNNNEKPNNKPKNGGKQKQQKQQKQQQKKEKEHDDDGVALKDLLDGSKIIGNVSWIIDFAVVGFPKCGTSFLMRFLMKSSQIYIHNHELCALTFNKPQDVVTLYHNISRINNDNNNIDNNDNNDNNDQTITKKKIGLKCPKDLESEYGLPHYIKYFPSTDFIVTTRHPILWFQSFYNYRVYQHYPVKMPPAETLIGPCRDDSPYVCAHGVTPRNLCTKQNVCTDRSKFHHILSRLGKTSSSKTSTQSKREKELLSGNNFPLNPIKGKVFLMEIGQLMADAPTAPQFSKDLGQFLGLYTNTTTTTTTDNDNNDGDSGNGGGLPPLYEHNRPGKYSEKKKTIDFINICESPKYDKLRMELLQNGKDSAEWIRDYFLKSHDVYVSEEKNVFLKLIDKWNYDPCLNDHGRRELDSLRIYDPYV